jgi:hypothetical protein
MKKILPSCRAGNFLVWLVVIGRVFRFRENFFFNFFFLIFQNDKRYLVLEPLAKERKDILLEHIEELARRGPPPPPTASEPTRRH